MPEIEFQKVQSDYITKDHLPILKSGNVNT